MSQSTKKLHASKAVVIRDYYFLLGYRQLQPFLSADASEPHNYSGCLTTQSLSREEDDVVIENVLIQKKAGEFASVNGWVAWSGFDQKAYPISFFEWSQLRDGHIQPKPETLVIGGVATVLHALRLLEAAPGTIDFPESLRMYLGRDIRATTLGEIRGQFTMDDPRPLFVKPRDVHKAFNGHVLSAFRDLIPTAQQPDDLTVWASEVIEFVSEWRYFVRRHEVIGVGHYQGDPFIHPDVSIVRAAVARYRDEASSAYGIDFGVANDGRTLLVEVNDAYSLGHIGLRPVPYTNMLEDRWVELMRKRHLA
jgi:hypothetical protein